MESTDSAAVAGRGATADGRQDQGDAGDAQDQRDEYGGRDEPGGST
ncbi:hypothetical protein ACFV0Y_26020 [Streptomyces sp. NPDC059569]